MQHGKASESDTALFQLPYVSVYQYISCTSRFSTQDHVKPSSEIRSTAVNEDALHVVYLYRTSTKYANEEAEA